MGRFVEKLEEESGRKKESQSARVLKGRISARTQRKIMKIIIAGSRSIKDPKAIARAIKASEYEITEIVSGTADGVDRLGEEWAEANNIPIKQFPADWNRYGRYAGIMRNAEMAQYADAAIVVWDGRSRGTKNMMEQMELRSKPCFLLRINYEGKRST